jgi:hypothetical protein
MNWDTWKIHPSSAGKILTNMPGKKDTKTVEELSDTTKTHLIECYVKEVYGREKDINNKFIEKGLAVEEDSLTLYSRIKKQVYFKNDELFSNDWIVGTPDIITSDSVIDIKSSWDIFTFFASKTKKIDSGYYAQLQCYMELAKRTNAVLAYCLIDTPDGLIEDEKSRLFYKMNLTSRENETYLQACEALEKQMRYGDIPIHERLFEFQFPFDSELIEAIKFRVGLCREFLNRFSEKESKKLIAA